MEKWSYGNQKYSKWKWLAQGHFRNISEKMNFLHKIVHFWTFVKTQKSTTLWRKLFFLTYFWNGPGPIIFIWSIFDYHNFIFPFRCSQVLRKFSISYEIFKLAVDFCEKKILSSNLFFLSSLYKKTLLFFPLHLFLFLSLSFFLLKRGNFFPSHLFLHAYPPIHPSSYLPSYPPGYPPST